MIIDTIRQRIHAGLAIQKPESKEQVVKGWGERRGEPALVYRIPDHNKPGKYHEKGITESEWEQAYHQIMNSGEFSKPWFGTNMKGCACEGGCSFTTIGGIFVELGLACYYRRGVYRKRA